VAVFAANPIPFAREFGRKVARIVLIDATELDGLGARSQSALSVRPSTPICSLCRRSTMALAAARNNAAASRPAFRDQRL
jgi:hypothetical protein